MREPDDRHPKPSEPSDEDYYSRQSSICVPQDCTRAQSLPKMRMLFSEWFWWYALCSAIFPGSTGTIRPTCDSVEMVAFVPTCVHIDWQMYRSTGCLAKCKSDNNTAWFHSIGSAKTERPRGSRFPWVVTQIIRHVIIALRTCAFHLCRIVLVFF